MAIYCRPNYTDAIFVQRILICSCCHLQGPFPWPNDFDSNTFQPVQTNHLGRADILANAIGPLRPITTQCNTSRSSLGPNVFFYLKLLASGFRPDRRTTAKKTIKNHRLLTDAHDLPLSLSFTRPFSPFLPLRSVAR